MTGKIVCELPPTEASRRSSEGSFATLKNGDLGLMFLAKRGNRLCLPLLVRSYDEARLGQSLQTDLKMRIVTALSTTVLLKAQADAFLCLLHATR